MSRRAVRVAQEILNKNQEKAMESATLSNKKYSKRKDKSMRWQKVITETEKLTLNLPKLRTVLRNIWITGNSRHWVLQQWIQKLFSKQCHRKELHARKRAEAIQKDNSLYLPFEVDLNLNSVGRKLIRGNRKWEEWTRKTFESSVLIKRTFQIIRKRNWIWNRNLKHFTAIITGFVDIICRFYHLMTMIISWSIFEMCVNPCIFRKQANEPRLESCFCCLR